MNGVSVIDAVEFLPRRAASRPDPALDPWAAAPAPAPEPVAAVRAPHPSGIPWHVIDAHEASKARVFLHGTATAEITFRSDTGAFELVTETREATDILRALGDGAKITIHY